MVKKYVILAYSNDKTFDIPRQLVEINGEPILKRTIRLLKENGVEDIVVTGHYDGLDVEIFNTKQNDFDYIKRTGYWLNAFPNELMNEPVCFIWGDVYFSEEAIKTIVETETDKNLFFCSYNNKSKKYIKEHDEPFAYKVVDTDLFKEHIERVKRLYDEGKTVRHPIVWEVYRSMNGLDVNEHRMTTNFVAINDITCDIDSAEDVDKIKAKIGGEEMIKVEVIEDFNFARFNEIKDTLTRYIPNKNEEGKLYFKDTFECDKDTCEYLTGKNPIKKIVVRIIEVIPEIEKPTKVKIMDIPDRTEDIKVSEEPIETKKTFKSKKKKKK